MSDCKQKSVDRFSRIANFGKERRKIVNSCGLTIQHTTYGWRMASRCPADRCQIAVIVGATGGCSGVSAPVMLEHCGSLLGASVIEYLENGQARRAAKA